MTVHHTRGDDSCDASGIARKPWLPRAASATAVVLIAGVVVTAGGGVAEAATAPQAQSVGNFLDASLSGQPIDSIAALQYASATSPGTQSVQNPLDATVLNAIDLPLTGAVRFPELAGADVGVLNQVAVAKASGESYGASGAVLNSGGISIGGDNMSFPTVASVDLCASALAGSSCGSSAADAIGELKLDLGAVAGLASTPAGYGQDGSTDYATAGVNLTLDSPLLGQLLGTVDTTLSGLVTQLSGLLGQVAGLPAACRLTSGFGTVPLENGAVTLDATSGSITISLDKLIAVLLNGTSINDLPANTDLLTYLLNYLTDPNGLAKGLADFVNGLDQPLKNKLDDCAVALGDSTPIGQVVGLLKSLIDALEAGKTTVETTLGNILSGLGGADASTLLGPLENLLRSVVDIGVNVQPNGPDGTFDTGLAATPKQGTPVLPDQTIVRAIEVDLLNSGGITPGAMRTAAREATDPAIALALGNAAAGPSTAPATPSTSTPPTSTPPTSTPPTTSEPTTGKPTSSSAPAAPSTETPLAITGADVHGSIAFALVALAVGLLCLLLARRRVRRH